MNEAPVIKGLTILEQGMLLVQLVQVYAPLVAEQRAEAKASTAVRRVILTLAEHLAPSMPDQVSPVGDKLAGR